MVKVLVATTEAQGRRADDYATAVDGELVYVPLAGCVVAPGDPSGCEVIPCGCDRGFAGMASNRPTTTAMVVERQDLGGTDLLAALSDSLERQGLVGPDWSDDDHEWFRQLFQRLLVTAGHFPVGSIIERDGDRIRRRALADPLPIPSDLVGGES